MTKAASVGRGRQVVSWTLGAAVIAVAVAVTYGAATGPKAIWVLSRGLGLGALVTLAMLTVVGIWRRHPLRAKVNIPRPAALATIHTVLASLTMVLVAGHIVTICADRYAHVGWVGALVPMQSPYRPWPVTLGTAGLWLLLAIWATARLQTSVAKKSWKAVHRAGMFTFGVLWLHTMTTGTDAAALRPFLIGLGAVVFGAWVSGVALLALERPARRPAPAATR